MADKWHIWSFKSYIHTLFHKRYFLLVMLLSDVFMLSFHEMFRENFSTNAIVVNHLFI